MEVLDAIKQRHCIRAFLKKEIPTHIIKDILEAARFAPSGVNSQPWQVVVVTGPYIKKIGDAIVAAREKNMPENPDYLYYPTDWQEPYKSRRKACGLALYSSIGIGLEDKAERKRAWYRNYYFFEAPVGLLFFVDKRLEKGSWVDMGMFIQNIMLAAQHFELSTCPQASLAEYPDIVRGIVGVGKDRHLICGMALGYEDTTAPINQYRLPREPEENFATWLGFGD